MGILVVTIITCVSSIDNKDIYIICSVEKLRQLLGGKCPHINCTSTIDIDYGMSGCCLTMIGCCGNGHVLDWTSSDFHTSKNGSCIFNINLSLASAIVVSGNSLISTFLRFMKVASIEKTTFHSYQRHFIIPAVNKFYINKQVYGNTFVFIYLQKALLEKFKLTDLVLSGDGRCDCPGKSAKFCTYSMMEITHNQILHFQNIDKCEVGLQSPNLEREGMMRCLNFLINSGMKITEVVTYSSTSVAKTRYFNKTNFIVYTNIFF